MKRSLPSSSGQPSKFIRWAPETKPAAIGFDLAHIPADYFLLGDQLFTSVSVFKDCVKVHVREYIMEGDLYRPSKKGVVFTPFGWQTLADKLDSYNYRRRHKVLVIQNEMIMTSVTENGQVSAVRFQRMFVKTDGALQFYPETVTLDLDQMEQLLISREYITARVKAKLYGPVLQKAIRMETTRRPTTIAEGEPLNVLAEVLKIHLQDHINELILCSGCDMDCANQLGHECITKNNCARARECFIRALFKINISTVAREFAQKNLILCDFDPDSLIDMVKTLYIEKDICCICKQEIFIERILKCNHVFCMRCIDKWLETNVTCPVCRTQVIQ